MITVDDKNLSRTRRDYVEPQLVNYGSIVDKTGSFLCDSEGCDGQTASDLLNP